MPHHWLSTPHPRGLGDALADGLPVRSSSPWASVAACSWMAASTASRASVSSTCQRPCIASRIRSASRQARRVVGAQRADRGVALGSGRRRPASPRTASGGRRRSRRRTTPCARRAAAAARRARPRRSGTSRRAGRGPSRRAAAATRPPSPPAPSVGTSRLRPDGRVRRRRHERVEATVAGEDPGHRAVAGRALEREHRVQRLRCARRLAGLSGPLVQPLGRQRAHRAILAARRARGNGRTGG